MQHKRTKVGWAFLRVSTADQAETQHGSLEQQRNMIVRWATTQSEKTGVLFNIEKYVEEDRSGRGSSIHLRKSLVELESAIRNSKIDFFVVEKIDRLSRDQIYNLQLVKLAQEYGVEIYENESGLIDLRDRGSRLGFNIKNMLSEEYSLELEEKITKKLREAMVNNGKDASSKPVLGLDNHPSKVCFYQINPEEQKIVIDIFQKFITVGSVSETVKYCKNKNYLTKLINLKSRVDKNGNIIPERSKGGELFDKKALRKLLSNHKLRGYSEFEDTWNQFPNLQDHNKMVKWDYGHMREQGPVVPIDLWNQVQDLLGKNKKNKSRSKSDVTYLLSGILFRSDGSKLTGASAKGGRNRYYEDRKNKDLRIPKEDIEKAVLERIRDYTSLPSLLRNLVERHGLNKSSRLDTLKAETNQVRFELASLTKAKS